MRGAVVHFVNLGSGPKTEAMRMSQALLAHRAFADVTTAIASIILHCNGAFGVEAGFSPQPRPSRSAHGRSQRRPEVNRSGCGRPVRPRRVGRGLGVGESSCLTSDCCLGLVQMSGSFSLVGKRGTLEGGWRLALLNLQRLRVLHCISS